MANITIVIAKSKKRINETDRYKLQYDVRKRSLEEKFQTVYMTGNNGANRTSAGRVFQGWMHPPESFLEHIDYRHMGHYLINEQ